MEHTLTQSESHTNVEIQGTPSNVADDALNDKVINIFHSLNINVNKDDIEDFHRLEKQVQLYDLLTVNFTMKFLIWEKWIVQNLISKQVL